MRVFPIALIAGVLFGVICGVSDEPQGSMSGGVSFITMDEVEVRDRIEGAWLGQMIGVTWGFPTEFYARYIWELFPEFHQVDGVPLCLYAEYEGGPIPLDELPEWDPEMINGGYTQDDLYVEVPFMEAMAEHGVNAGWRELGDAFAASEFPLWHANKVGRDNLRAGIAAPMSGHYSNNPEADDIDWQIEADFVGLMNPGQPHSAAETSFRVGHVMNYGDGVYGGVFVATMISTAFTAESIREVCEAGRRALPEQSQYRIVLDEVFDAYDSGEDYEDNLAALYDKWGTVDRCEEWAGDSDPLNIDAKLNGAFILLGLLYGEGDIAATMRYSMAAGQDSDCNPSNAGSVLGAFYGAEALANDPRWLSALDRERVFDTTPYTLGELIDLNVDLARGVVELKGGSAPEGGVWQIPVVQREDIVIFEQWPIEENEPPVLNASVEVDGRRIRVSAGATDEDGIAAFQWFFGDLTYATGAEHVHTYRETGRYEVVAYVSDAIGNTSFEVITVTIHD